MILPLAFNELIFSFQLVHSMQLKKKRFVAPILADYVIRKFATLYTRVLIHSIYGKKESEAPNFGKIVSKATMKHLKELFATQI